MIEIIVYLIIGCGLAVALSVTAKRKGKKMDGYTAAAAILFWPVIMVASLILSYLEA